MRKVKNSRKKIEVEPPPENSFEKIVDTLPHQMMPFLILKAVMGVATSFFTLFAVRRFM